MRDYQVASPSDALAYLLDCSLATIAHMAMMKQIKKGEFDRQISIAQKNVDWCIEFKANIAHTRAVDVIEKNGGSVKSWANSIREEWIRAVAK